MLAESVLGGQEVSMAYKSTGSLMRHLRQNGIAIGGSSQKRQLENTGYFHGYKGYRFFQDAKNRLPFTSYKEVYATIQYDAALKSLFYGKIMYIETAVKNIALDAILKWDNSESIQVMFEKAIVGYNHFSKEIPDGITKDKKRALQRDLQIKKLNLQTKIHKNIADSYRRGNPQVVHFYNKGNVGKGNVGVPLWALFEILMMGDFGELLSCLIYDVRDDISRRLGLNKSCDTNRQLVYKYVFLLKDLRNAIAHNSVIFDARFRSSSPNNATKQCLQQEIGLPYVNFNTIGDYVLLVCYYLKLLHVSKTEIRGFIREFEKVTRMYHEAVNPNVAKIVIHPDLAGRLEALKNFI